jgi:hypothetical protein
MTSDEGDGGGDWAAPGSSTPPPGWSTDQPPPAPSGYGAPSGGAPSGYGTQPGGYPPPATDPAAAPGQPPGYPPPGYGAPPGWNTAYQAPPVAPRPGIVPLRPLGVGELLDGAFTAIRRYPRATLGLAAGVSLVQQLLGLLVDRTTGGFASPSTTGVAAYGTVSGLLSAVISAVLSATLLGMLSLVIGEAVLGRQVSLGQLWAKLRPMLWRLLLAAFLAAVLPVLGLVALIVGGVFLWVVLSFTTPALVLENLTVMAALRRSWRLALPSFWRVLGIRLLALLISTVVAGILSLPGIIVALVSVTHSFSGGVAHFGVGAEIAIRLSSLIATTITAPFMAGVLSLLYIDRRIRAEALDVTLARAAAEAPQG